MNIALADGRQEDLELLSDLLKDYASLHGLHFTLFPFQSGEELTARYRPRQYALIFLDVFLSGSMTGVQAAERIRSMDEDVCLVVLTASTRHQAGMIRWHVFDYLSKSRRKENVFRTLDRLLRLKTEEPDQLMTFVSERKTVSIRFRDLVYLTADRNYVIFHDSSGAGYRTRMTFSAAREKLRKDARFLMILRGIIVNMDYLTDISSGICTLRGEIRLPVSVRGCGRIEQVWADYARARLPGSIMEKALPKAGGPVRPEAPAADKDEILH